MTGLSLPDTATNGASSMYGASTAPSIHPASVAQSGTTRLLTPAAIQSFVQNNSGLTGWQNRMANMPSASSSLYKYQPGTTAVIGGQIYPDTTLNWQAPAMANFQNNARPGMWNSASEAMWQQQWADYTNYHRAMRGDPSGWADARNTFATNTTNRANEWAAQRQQERQLAQHVQELLSRMPANWNQRTVTPNGQINYPQVR